MFSHIVRVTLLPAIAFAATPALAQQANVPAPQMPPPLAVPPPVVQPTIVLPKVSSAQAAFLRSWLENGAKQGLTGARTGLQSLSGDALVRAALDHARALHSGRIGEGDFLQIWALRPAPYDPLPAFAEAVQQDRLQQWSSNLTPRYSGYEGLRRGLEKYQKIKAAGGWGTLAASSSAAEIRKRLKLEDDSVTDDEPIGAAIQRAQKRYGLEPTGGLGTRTLAALNVPVSSRIDAITANMERWRWLPAQLPTDRVQVNIAAAVLTVFKGDEPVSSMRAVTGRPGNETPMLVSSIRSIVVNPPWNVPSSIAKKELWPKGRGALQAQGYKIIKTPDGGERIVQPAGPNSALGRLKFDFDNPFAVYLHDTPARARFSSYDRLASHGCVRLEKPVPLAELMVQDDPALSGNIQTLIDAGKTQRVSLPKEVSVYLLYWTAFASANGSIGFRDDPYGWDKLLADKIEASENRAQAAVTAS
ncbi:MAG: L,D-transpeptidase family protein [Sphingobium sp.]|nr:L,D-transpeptidase family protein [Sphingobium sp.]